MLESTFFNVNNHYEPNAAAPERPAWFNVRLTFADGATIDVLAAMSAQRITVEEVRADLPLDGFTVAAAWVEGPLGGGCRVVAEAPGAAAEAVPEQKQPPAGRARPAWPGGRAGRRIAAEAYRAAQQAGQDPVLAVMCATGRSRRRSLRLIAGARDEGHLSPRHHRR
ncbi:DUF6214 family protein [Streptomyces chryseus]|uniref:Uncharacterized protein n=1 Tax=Streptomyces chryseus TaxID=68186 RepID=A0ABQ3DME6_9ACTN|nr:DUF6214 family protein [Streptomyces chryseus]GGX21512.1 hypothetical protein GCM10010353_40810 [Streptomyces chryseus]GHB02718.1 hypothetical protein GCM10010346_27220 [Streptomyces chryseus]